MISGLHFSIIFSRYLDQIENKIIHFFLLPLSGYKLPITVGGNRTSRHDRANVRTSKNNRQELWNLQGKTKRSWPAEKKVVVLKNWNMPITAVFPCNVHASMTCLTFNGLVHFPIFSIYIIYIKFVYYFKTFDFFAWIQYCWWGRIEELGASHTQSLRWGMRMQVS